MPPHPRRSPEDLVQLIVENDERHRNPPHPFSKTFHVSHRVWIEPLFNLIGQILGRLVLLLTWPTVGRVHRWFCFKLAGSRCENNPQLSRRTQEAVQIAQALYRKKGQWPIVLIGTSHPNTKGANAWLRFELLRQGLVIAAALIEAAPPEKPRRPPQCFLAIDPFALDSVPVPVQGLYAGFMHAQYLVWDRMVSTQSWIQRHVLLRRTGHAHVAWRVLRALRRNPVLMAISGGLPHNARLLYAAREFMTHLRVATWGMSRREAQHRLLSLLKEPCAQGFPSATGQLDSVILARIQALLLEVGMAPEAAALALKYLERDFAREVPARKRLWKVLIGRFVKKGIPVLFVPITHRLHEPFVVLGESLGMSQAPVDLDAWVEVTANRYKIDP